MTQTIYLTNVSFSFNSFKLLPLNEKIKDFFDIVYVPSGRISAGMQVPIKISFTCGYDEYDIALKQKHNSLPLLLN